MNNIIVFFKGKKTYIIATLLFLVGAVNFITGDLGLTDLMSDPNTLIMLNGVGLFTLRAGVSK